MKKKMNPFRVKSCQTLGRFGIYDYLCSGLADMYRNQ